HGYARWQAIVEDKDFGFVDIVRQEQNLPFVNGFVTGCAQTNGPSVNGVNFSGTSDSQMQGSVNGNVYGPPADAAPDGTSEVPRGNLSFPDASTLYQFREVQRRVVEFIRKRFFLLEKAIHTEELLKENAGNPKQCESAANDIEPEPIAVPILDACDLHPQLLNELPELQPIAPGEPKYDDESDRRHVALLYNEICKTVEDNADDSVKALLGDQSAGLRLRKNLQTLDIIYEDVRRALVVKQQHPANVRGLDKNAHPQVETGSSIAASQSDKDAAKGERDPPTTDAPPTVDPRVSRKDPVHPSTNTGGADPAEACTEKTLATVILDD
ncbi:hypothetical protein Taro_008328, partial [Colocasia esculenta]|nr:hypothetical protein [Colocasia esculenta]